MLSIGVDSVNTSGYDALGPNAAVRITGPLRSQEAVNTLFDVREPCANATLRSLTQHFVPMEERESTLGLMREWWAWNAFGPNRSDAGIGTKDNKYPGSYIAGLGCSKEDSCATEVITSGTLPNGTDVLIDPMGLYFPPAWRRFRSYVVRLSGWFVPPFDADYRFVIHGFNWERSSIYLSSDYTEGNKQLVASKRGGMCIRPFLALWTPL